ncbi:MAG TPA: hypothetical protein VH208_06485 [Myxococcaceae bacterium]|jgi:hypothetical protein|nr:hypothetical protein [Myxococcaceae bacterium]
MAGATVPERVILLQALTEMSATAGYQNDPAQQPLLCAVDPTHQRLVPRYNQDTRALELYCPQGDYVTADIPDAARRWIPPFERQP